jgi:alpha-1,3-mannosyltransferase
LFRGSDQSLPSKDEVDGIPVERLGYWGSERYPLCPQVLGAIASADVVHVHGIDFFFDYLAWTLPLHRKSLVASTHGGFFHTEFAQRLKRLYFATVTRTSALSYRRLIATSESDGATFSKIVSGHRLKVIENGVDVEKYADAASPRLLRSIIYFGRWSENKGILETLDRFAALHAASTEPWRLIIAGAPYDLKADDIVRRAIALRLEPFVTVVASPDVSELRSLIAQCSYFICLSRHEGFGLSAVEAMSAGLVPILSDIPPFRRLLARCKMGILLGFAESESSAARNVLSLHDSLDRLDHDAARANLQARSRDYSWNIVARSYADVYAGAGSIHEGTKP